MAGSGKHADAKWANGSHNKRKFRAWELAFCIGEAKEWEGWKKFDNSSPHGHHMEVLKVYGIVKGFFKVQIFIQ